MAAPVQQQIREQRETVARLSEQPDRPDAEMAEALGLLGRLLMAAESIAAAEPYVELAARLEPDVPRWPYYLGHVHRMLGDLDEAADRFEQTLAIEPADVAALVWLGQVRLDQGRAEEALGHYTRALELRPGLFAALAGTGRAHLVLGNADRAVAALEAALAAEPRASAVHYPLALAYRARGQVAEAEAHLRLRGELEPGPPDPLMADLATLLESPVVFEGQGDRLLARGDAPAAVAAFRRALALAPERAALKQKLATSLAVAGEIPAALELYQELLDANPDFAEAHYSLGALLLGSGRPDLAVERFEAAVRAEPTYLQARLQLAHALRRAGRPDAALGEYQRTLDLDPRMAEARLAYAVALADLGRWGAARAWLNEGRRAHPDRLEFPELLVRVLAAAPDGNVRDGALAADLATDLLARARTWRTLEASAMALAETGRFDEATARQREAIEAHRRERGEPPPAMRDALAGYVDGRPARVPWPVDPVG
jgi:tetratricopeptide (TPR) repeat protein